MMNIKKAFLVSLVPIFLTSCSGTYVEEEEQIDTQAAPKDFSVIEFAQIPSGTFLMGERQAGVEVTISRGFEMSTTEITQAAWLKVFPGSQAFENINEHSNGIPTRQAVKEGRPATGVNWFSALAFCNSLSLDKGLEACYDLSSCTGDPGMNTYQCDGTKLSFSFDCEGYRLPTDAEWEYAARAGTTTDTYLGDFERGESFESAQKRLDVIKPIAWIYETTPASNLIAFQPVGLKQPNAFGLYDMIGNTNEWVWDWMGQLDRTPRVDPTGPESPEFPEIDRQFKVIRGGSILTRIRDFTISERSSGRVGGPALTGFRIVRGVK